MATGPAVSPDDPVANHGYGPGHAAPSGHPYAPEHDTYGGTSSAGVGGRGPWPVTSPVFEALARLEAMVAPLDPQTTRRIMSALLRSFVQEGQ